MSKVAIIGGGASGLFCAIEIKKHNPDIDVVILERLERVGKKILSTGNGKCNFSNSLVSKDKYNNPQFVEPFLNEYSKDKLYQEFLNLGLLYREDKEGRMYPYSESANSFLDVLRNNLKKYKIKEKCNYEVTKISFSDETFYIENTRREVEEADYVVVATGGKAYPVLGSNGSGYSLLRPWKVKITDTLPGLVGLKVDESDIKGLSGLRYKAKVSLVDKKSKQKVHEEEGEIQFKDDGISGIVIMQMSSMISRANIIKSSQNFYFDIDLLPDMSEDAVIEMLLSRRETFKEFEAFEFLNGVFPKNLGFLLLKKTKLDMSSYIENISNKDIIKLASIIKSFVINYKGMYGFDRAQVTVGGVDLSEISKDLSLKKVSNLFLCGEVMNIDGECGGYNMHWAFVSGYIVAKSIIERSELYGQSKRKYDN